MNDIEVGRLLAMAVSLDPKMPQDDAQGFVRRVWTAALHDVPADVAQRALVDYYRSDRYAMSRETVSPADIVQFHNARRRPTESERTGVNRATRRELPRPPADSAAIHAGVDRVFAALAHRKAIGAGEDPGTALDVAESVAAARRLERSVVCPHCSAAMGQPCVNHRGEPLSKSPAHQSRLDLAMGKPVEVKPRLSSSVAAVELASVDLERFSSPT